MTVIYIVVLTKRVANENLKVIRNENFLSSLHCFLLRSRGFKCYFIDFFSRDTLALKRSGFIKQIGQLKRPGGAAKCILFQMLKNKK